MDLHNHKSSAVRKLALAQIRLIFSLFFILIIINCFNITFAHTPKKMSMNPVVISSSVKQTATVSIILLVLNYIIRNKTQKNCFFENLYYSRTKYITLFNLFFTHFILRVVLENIGWFGYWVFEFIVNTARYSIKHFFNNQTN